MENNSSKGLFKRYLPILAGILLALVTSVQCHAQSSKKDISSYQYLQVIEELYQYIQENYVEEVDPQTLYEGALRGMLNSLDDPYSEYLNQEDWRSITDTTSGSFGGVGLSISKPNESTPEKPAYVEVVSPIDDSPGAKAGIQPGDKIIKIGDVDTTTITMEEVLNLLRGPKGTDVKVTILRGKSLTFEVTLTRAIIENPTVKYGMIGKTGYIRLSSFSGTTATRFQEALDSFKAQGYTSLIIDLRNNGGGLLSTAVNIADKFIDDGVIVSTKSRISYENITYSASKNKTVVKGIPVIVLINEGSASASEILAGALKDAKVAYLVGANTYGKGSVQIPTQLLNNDGFKITVARYYTPSDVNIDKTGIPPDREILYPEFTEEDDAAYLKLIEDDVITKYVENHPDMSEDDIASYALTLQKDYNLEARFLRKMIRNEVYRTKTPLLYDLDYDIQLTAALDILKNEDVSKLIKNSKTLKQLQDAKELKEKDK